MHLENDEYAVMREANVLYTDEQPMPASIRRITLIAGAAMVVTFLIAAVSRARAGDTGTAMLLGTVGLLLGVFDIVVLPNLLTPLRVRIEGDTLTVGIGVFPPTRVALRDISSCRPVLSPGWGSATRIPPRTYPTPESGATGVDVRTGRKQIWFSSQDPETVCRLINAGGNTG